VTTTKPQPRGKVVLEAQSPRGKQRTSKDPSSFLRRNRAGGRESTVTLLLVGKKEKGKGRLTAKVLMFQGKEAHRTKNDRKLQSGRMERSRV